MSNLHFFKGVWLSPEVIEIIFSPFSVFCCCFFPRLLDHAQAEEAFLGKQNQNPILRSSDSGLSHKWTWFRNNVIIDGSPGPLGLIRKPTGHGNTDSYVGMLLLKVPSWGRKASPQVRSKLPLYGETLLHHPSWPIFQRKVEFRCPSSPTHRLHLLNGVTFSSIS